MSIFIKCDEANHTCDKNQYKEASLIEFIKLNIHLMYCRACRQYTARNTKLSKAFKNSKVQTMPQNVKVSLKQKIEQELSK